MRKEKTVSDMINFDATKFMGLDGALGLQVGMKLITETPDSSRGLLIAFIGILCFAYVSNKANEIPKP